ncbi:hypothetical protein IQ268_21245 [Oculatella sp. LEGE 06141]|uniref:hypothetical protein n=1 Tax=Oculatella sp. LEGE 06141 TaxID=1828648 RepID=UPI00187EDF69|nr:hypothetical protein [Oculatella sp. LEGE 06141]MBE9181090.1 hypothetical protein [Oculatella sp. LEGE 06141]
MSRSERFPVSLRYIKARLRVLKRRPAVWGSAAGLLAIAIASVYWVTSDQGSTYSSNASGASGVTSLDGLTPGQRSTGSLLSDEERAIGADIDNLPLLLDEMDNFNQSSSLGLTGEPSQATAPPELPQQAILSGLDADVPLLNDNLGRGLERQQSSQSNSLTNQSRPSNSTLSDPVEFDSNNSRSNGSGLSAAEAQSPPGTGSFGVAPATGVNGYNAPTTSDQSSSTSSPLQSAIESSTPNSAIAPAAPAAGMTTGQFNQNLPQTSPPPGTTGYVIPPSLRAPNPVIPNSGVPNSGGYSNFNGYPSVPGLQPAPQLAPTIPQPQYNPPQSYITPNYGTNQTSVSPYGYSAPVPQPQVTQPELQEAPLRRPGIGRPIGGGEINTFSNP